MIPCWNFWMTDKNTKSNNKSYMRVNREINDFTKKEPINNIEKKLSGLENASYEDIFEPINIPIPENLAGAEAFLKKFKSWARELSQHQTTKQFLELPPRELGNLFIDTEKLSCLGAADLFKSVVTSASRSVEKLPAYGKTGREMSEWFNENPEAKIAMKLSVDSFQAFEADLYAVSDVFFKQGKTITDREREKLKNTLVDERGQFLLEDQIKRANKEFVNPILNRYWIEIQTATEKKDVDSLARIAHELQESNAVFKKMFSKSVRSEYNISAEDIRDVVVETRDSTWLTDRDKKEMTEMAIENWSQTRPDYVSQVVQNLEKAFEETSPGTFHILRHNEKIFAFLHSKPFSYKGERGLWFSSLNVDPQMRGHDIAKAFGSETVKLYGEKNDIFADVFPETDAGTMYVEKLNFSIIGIYDPTDSEDASKIRLLLRRPADKTKQQPTTKGILIRNPESFDHTNAHAEAFRLPTDSGIMIEIVNRLTEAGEIGTRYFKDARDPAVRWIVFEKITDAPQIQMAA